MTFDTYDSEIHRLFIKAFTIRSDKNSTLEDLHYADYALNKALDACNSIDKEIQDKELLFEVENNRIRCFIERLAIQTRLMKKVFGLPHFDGFSSEHEKLCFNYLNYKPTIINNEILLSHKQLIITAYQSLSANYYRKGKLTDNKDIYTLAITYIDKAIEACGDDEFVDVLMRNKAQILSVIAG